MRICAGFGAPDCKNVPVNGKTLCNTCSSRKKRHKQRETLLNLQNQFNSLLEKYNGLLAEHTALKLSYQRQFDTLLQEYQRLAKAHSEPLLSDAGQSEPGENATATACRLLFLSQQQNSSLNNSLNSSLNSSLSLSLPLYPPFGYPTLRHSPATAHAPSEARAIKPLIAPAHSHSASAPEESEWVYLKDHHEYQSSA